MTFEEQIEQVVATVDLGEPAARRKGRRSEWPYVPVIVLKGAERQIQGLAFEFRKDAVLAASQQILHERRVLARRLAAPRNADLREQYGLPREVPVVEGLPS